jgi:hypothetical protein
MLISYSHAKLHIPSFNSSLVLNVKTEAIENVRNVAILLF